MSQVTVIEARVWPTRDVQELAASASASASAASKASADDFVAYVAREVKDLYELILIADDAQTVSFCAMRMLERLNAKLPAGMQHPKIEPPSAD